LYSGKAGLSRNDQSTRQPATLGDERLILACTAFFGQDNLRYNGAKRSGKARAISTPKVDGELPYQA